MPDFKLLPTVNGADVALANHLHPGDELALWLHAGSLALTDGAAVASWSDLSGAAHHAAQATSGARPAYKTGIINGYPVVRFTTDDWLAVPGLAGVFSGTDPAFSVMVVVKLNALGTDQGLVTAGNTAGGQRLDFPSINSSNVYRTYRVDNASGTSLQGGGVANLAPHVVTLVCPGTTVGIWVDGAAVVAPGTSHDVGATTFDGAAIGAVFRASPVDFLNGDVAQVIVYGRALSTIERQRLEASLAAEYALAVPSAFATAIKWGTD